jgi:hypothetical protein
MLLFSWQLLLSSWKRSLIPGVFGLVAGSLYRLNVFGIRKMKVSKDLFSCLYLHFCSTTSFTIWNILL